MPTVAITGQTLINAALEMLGINELGGTPSASESQSALNELNAMWNTWGIDQGIIYAEQTISQILVATTASYTIGTGATWNTPAPGRVYKAFIISSDGGRNEIDVVNADRYYSHNDLAATAVVPDEVYYDFNIAAATGYGTVYLWPVPSSTPTLQLTTGAEFAAWTLSGTVYIPQGYQDAIQYALAWRLIPRYGLIVPDTIKQMIAGLAEKAELRIREMNKVNRQLPPGTEMLQPPTAPPAVPRP